MSEPIRILQVFAGMNRGGAETMIMNWYRNIDRSKIQFDFIVHTEEICAYDEEIKKLGGRIYRVPRYTGKNHFSYKTAWKQFFKIHPEYRIIHGHVRSTASIYLKIAKKFKLKTIIHSHSIASRGNKIEKIIKNIMQYSIRYISDYFFSCSDEAGEWLFGKSIVKNKKYIIIKNAIDIDKYIFNEQIRKEIRQSFKIENKFVVGHVGSFTSPKNHLFLLEIFNEVLQLERNSKLILVGDGILKEKIVAKINELEIYDNVILVGDVPNVHEYLQGMDILIFPSLFEGLGISLIEAQASGLTCIVSDTIPKEAEVTDSVYRMSLNKSAKEWAGLIIECSDLNRTKNVYSEIREKGYCISDIVFEIEKLYLNIINN